MAGGAREEGRESRNRAEADTEYRRQVDGFWKVGLPGLITILAVIVYGLAFPLMNTTVQVGGVTAALLALAIAGFLTRHRDPSAGRATGQEEDSMPTEPTGEVTGRVAVEYIPICSACGALDGQLDEATAEDHLRDHLAEEHGQREDEDW